jgi:hypothetical protein
MFFSKARRERLFEVDARWPVKIAFRMILNLICVFSIICALFTLTHNSTFAPKPFAQARAVLVYVPCVSGISPPTSKDHDIDSDRMVSLSPGT